MSRCLVTGAAGFIGSHLAEALIEEGHEVVGVDAFIDYYPRPIKEANLTRLRDHQAFTFHEADLRTAEIAPIIDGCDVVFNEAAMAGLMRSWTDFDLYASCNERAVLRLLEAAREVKLPHFIQISTSSVYGRNATGDETTLPAPSSPYGITKLAAEHLCRAFEANFNLPVTVLRYFSVYGPRQRPDMAYHILIRCLMNGEPFTMFGDGEQTRSNTFVSDCVAATLAAFRQRDAAVGETFNIGGGEVISLNEVIALLEELTGKTLDIERQPARPGDQRHTQANIEKARRVLGYDPKHGIREGIEREVAWYKTL